MLCIHYFKYLCILFNAQPLPLFLSLCLSWGVLILPSQPAYSKTWPFSIYPPILKWPKRTSGWHLCIKQVPIILTVTINIFSASVTIMSSCINICPSFICLWLKSMHFHVFAFLLNVGWRSVTADHTTWALLHQKDSCLFHWENNDLASSYCAAELIPSCIAVFPFCPGQRGLIELDI